MMRTFSRYIGRMGFFGAVVIPKPNGFFVDRNVGAPFVLKPNYTQKPGLISAIWAAYVLCVATVVDFTKIAKSVVGFVAVDMVNKAIRPFAMLVKPCKSVGFINPSSNANGAISFVIWRSGQVVGFNRFARTDTPSKLAGIRVVCEQFPELFGRNKLSVHGAFPW